MRIFSGMPNLLNMPFNFLKTELFVLLSKKTNFNPTTVIVYSNQICFISKMQ